MKRFISIWLPHLLTDWMVRKQPALKDVPFVSASPEHGRMIVKTASTPARMKGALPGMPVADCRALCPQLQVYDHEEDRAALLLEALAEWCVRFTPVVAVDLPDGLLLDASGCAHLWGGEQAYLKDITLRLSAFGYQVRAAMADTIGAAWAMARYARETGIIPPGRQAEALLALPPAALRLEAAATTRLEKLGLYQIGNFIRMPRRVLRRRFGDTLLKRIDQALGTEAETLIPVQPVEPYQERLPCLEPIRTAAGIEIALQRLLEKLSKRLAQEGKGLRCCTLKAYRVDGQVQQTGIGTTRPTRHTDHLMKLFKDKIGTLEPDLGFELFLLEAPVVEEIPIAQETLWITRTDEDIVAVGELLDRLAGKLGVHTLHRYLPDEHYWPERSVKEAATLMETPAATWRRDLPRPIHLLPEPEPLQVAVALPDYPPMHFHYQNKLHVVTRADGPERIEQEWWLQGGLFRDYYCVEDEEGRRYWLFRLGPYGREDPKWFMHGFFA